MSNLRLYIPPPWPQAGETIALDEGAVRHISVLRLHINDSVELFDGVDRAGQAVITSIGKKKGECRLESTETGNDHSPLHITLYQAFPKSDKFDSIIQKTTELGVERIVPVSTERSAPVPRGERLEKKLDHWRKIAIEASRQCGRISVPEVLAPKTLSELKQDINDDALRMIMHTDSSAQNMDTMLAGSRPGRALIFVGPEGGFSEEEIAFATAMGWKTAGCGPRIMRTETAGPTIVALLQYTLGDLRTTQ